MDLMEEVWNNMSLISSSTPAVLQYHLPAHSTTAVVHLQDYLVPVRVTSLQPANTPPPTALALNLSSNLEFTYLGAAAASCPSNSSSGDDSALMTTSSDPFGAPTDIFSFAAAAGTTAGGVHCPTGAGGGDRRQRRMIKNRESAARSRARKQAYTNELELELVQLRRDNKMLVKRDEELNVRVRLAMAAQVPDRSTLQRSSSAPPRTAISPASASTLPTVNTSKIHPWLEVVRRSINRAHRSSIAK